MASSRKRSQDEVKEAERKKRKEDAVRQPQGGHYGLYNQGATCYLNSVLQVLFMTPEIHDRLNPKSQITDEELRNLFEELKKATCGTKKITDVIAIKNVRQQRDAAECLEMILQKLSPQASEVFEGQLTYTTKCSKRHSIIEEMNPFWILPLSLKDTDESTYSVERGFQMIFQLKSFSGDNMVYCNECEEKTEATTGCEMVKYPQILTLLLKRFDFDYSTMSYSKSHRCVDVSRTLQRQNNKYRLYGMVNHMGGLAGGHYTATILSHEDNTWYEFNDDHINKVEEQPFAQNRTYNSSTAYLLVYRASNVRDRGKGRQDMDEQREQKRKREAAERENRFLEQNQESRRPMKKAVKKAVSLQVQKESLILDIKEEDALLHPEQNTRYPSQQRPVDHTTAERRKQRLQVEEGENCPQPCRNPTGIHKKALLISLVSIIGALIVIVPVLVMTLKKS